MLRILALAVFASACGAGFGGTHLDAGAIPDGGGDGFEIAAAVDLAGTPAGADLAQVSSGPQTIATGSFVKGQQNGGDTGQGTGSLERNADGSETVVFGADFQSTQVPAAEVVLTARSSIGTGGIQSGDLDLGPLKSSSGAQRYSLSAADGGRRNLFVYCTTFGIDVAVAHLQ